MAHFKRKKTKRRVRCTLCTPYKWMGNNVGRRGDVVLSGKRDPQKMRRAIGLEAEA